MLNKLSKIILFYFAYLPLFIVLIINNINNLKWIIYSSIIIFFVGLFLTFLLLRTVKNVAGDREKVKINELKNSEYLSFLVTYIAPFIITFSSVKEIISLTLILAITFYIYLDTTLFCVNPLLKIFFKYNIYSVSIKEKNYFLISKKSYVVGERNISVKKMDGGIILEDEQ